MTRGNHTLPPLLIFKSMPLRLIPILSKIILITPNISISDLKTSDFVNIYILILGKNESLCVLYTATIGGRDLMYPLRRFQKTFVILIFSILLLLSSKEIYAARITLAWNPNTEPDLAGYKLYYGHSSRNYIYTVDVGNQTRYTLTGLKKERIYFIATTAYDINGNESDFSKEVIGSTGSDTLTVYEDAEDRTVKRWQIYDASPAGAEINNVFATGPRSRVIKFTGSGIENGYWLRNDDGSKWHNKSQFVVKWTMKYSESFVVYIDTETTAGHRYIYYTPATHDGLGNGEYVHHGLGTYAMNGRWHTFVRDLQADLDEAQPGEKILEVNGFLIRGSGRVDDIALRIF